MGNEKYVNYYIETLTSVMNDAIINNVSLQANSKVTEEVVQEQAKIIEELKQHIESMNQLENNQIDSLNNTINTLNAEIFNLRVEINNSNKLKVEYDNTKNQIQHLDTFRNELLKSQKENENIRLEYEYKIKGLEERIEYLQLSPAKRKKIDESQSNNKTTISTTLEVEGVKDGGSF